MTDTWPITLEEAAARLHVKKLRWLREHCKRVGLGRRIPGDIIFDASDFQRLYESLTMAGEKRNESAAPAHEPSEIVVKRQLERLERQRGRRSPRNYLKQPLKRSGASG